jgi:hypothetical protein
MLAQKLLGATASAKVPPIYVGFNSGFASGSGNVNFSFGPLTGGVDTEARQGDYMLFAIGRASTTDTNWPSTLSTNNSGTTFTKLADLFVNNGSNALNFAIYGALQGPITSGTPVLTISQPGSTRFGGYVWRGASGTLGASIQTSTFNNTGRPDAPAVTTTTEDNIVIAMGCTSTSTALTVPSGMENFGRVGGLSAAAPAFASALVASPGTYDPATFGGGSTSSAQVSFAATIALQPA